MCQINLSTAVYVDCGHSKESSFRNPGCEEIKSQANAPKKTKTSCDRPGSVENAPIVWPLAQNQRKQVEGSHLYYVLTDTFWLIGSKPQTLYFKMNLIYWYGLWRLLPPIKSSNLIYIYSSSIFWRKTTFQAKFGSTPLVTPKLNCTLHSSTSWWLASNTLTACGLAAEIRANWTTYGLRGFWRLGRVGCLPKSHKTGSRRQISHPGPARTPDHGDISHSVELFCSGQELDNVVGRYWFEDPWSSHMKLE